MLEKETDRLLVLIQQQTIAKNEAISVREILAAEIPYPIKVFFRSDVDRILNDELQRTRANSRFNYFHKEVESLQRQINSVLVLNFSFLREEFLQKLEDGVHLVLNFLLRPQWTLTSFLFNTNASVPVSDLKSMLTYFGAYEYLKEVLLRYIDGKKLESLTMNEFQNLLWRIDAEYIHRKSGFEIARMTTPIYDFIHFSSFPHSAAAQAIPVPTKVLIKFFEDKRLHFLCNVLERHHAHRAIEELTMEQLQSILEEAHHSNAEAFRAEETFVKRQMTPTMQPEHSSTDHSLTSLPAEGELRSQNERGKEENLPDLHQLISEDDRKKFLKKIFKKDDASYASSLHALNAMTSWKEASIYIDKILIANNIDPYSSEAVRFSELVHHHFFPRTTRR